MIAHLQGREQALQPFGWTGRRAKWIALACLYSGVFTRAQWTRFLGCHTEKVRRAVHALIAQGVAAEENVPGITGISRVCRIYGRGIYTGRTRANRRVEGTGSQASWPGADSPRHHLADRAPLRSALPMTDLRLMPPLGCENDVGGRFTVCPVPDSHGTRRVSAEAAVSYASAARPVVARRADEAEMGATPQAEGLVRAWGWVCFHTPVPALQGSLPVHQSLAGRPSSAGGGGAVRRSAISAPAGGLGGRCPRPPVAPAATRGRRDVCAPLAAWVHQRLGVRQTPRAECRPVGISTRWPRSSKLSTGSATWTRRAACGWSGRGDARDMAGDADGLRSLAGPRPRR